jgi:4-hydroxy-tetrahydrodipicolinate reductase
MSTRVVCCGLGPIGLAIARVAYQRPGLQIVGAVDVDPQKVGQDLGVLLGGAPSGVVVTSDLGQTLERVHPEVVLHATGSSLSSVISQLRTILRLHAECVSTCEELSYPWTVQPQLAVELDTLARREGVTLLGTGVNPGFAMDALPLMLTAVCSEVRAVRVLRVVDAARRRGPLQRKVGAGLTPEQFAEKVREGAVRHVGLPESLHMVSTLLGMHLERSEDLIEPVIATQPIMTDIVNVQPGQVAGVRQVARGIANGREVVTLELRMYVGAEDPQDTVEIDGTPPIRMTVPGGFHGDIATAAIAVNAVSSVLRAGPGLASMGDLPLVHYWQGKAM